MREQTAIPAWALRHIRDQLRAGEEVINAVAFRQGLFSGVVLFNTSKGAAIVSKGILGEPRSALLTYPRDLTTFRCDECASRNLLLEVDLPSDVYCTQCAAPHHVEASGRLRKHLGEAAPVEGAARDPLTKKEGKKSAKKPAKKVTKKSAKRPAKKGTKRAARKTTNRPSKKTVQKSPMRSTKRAAKKTTKKPAKKSTKKAAKKPGPTQRRTTRSAKKTAKRPPKKATGQRR